MNSSDNIIDQALGVLDPVETELKKVTTKKVVVRPSSNEDDIENDYKYQQLVLITLSGGNYYIY